MFLKPYPFLAASLVAVLALTGCGRKPPRAPEAAADAPAPAYATPPSVTEVRGLTLSGAAPAGALVRLATPGGAAMTVSADAGGHWRIVLPPSAEARIFGLSARIAGRQVQSQGYVLVDPTGRAALLRSGAGAIRLDPRPNPSLSALDYDGQGGAVISGTAPPLSLVYLRLDGRQIAEAKTGPGGHYAFPLAQPLSRGDHRLEVAGDAFTVAAHAAVAAPAPLVAGPLRRQLVTGGLRADWLTPGGGVQSTLLLD